MEDLRRLIAGTCPWVNVEKRKYIATCGAHFPDLERPAPPPPDLPPYIGAPRLVVDNPDVPKRGAGPRALSGHPDDEDEDDEPASAIKNASEKL